MSPNLPNTECVASDGEFHALQYPGNLLEMSRFMLHSDLPIRICILPDSQGFAASTKPSPPSTVSARGSIVGTSFPLFTLPAKYGNGSLWVRATHSYTVENAAGKTIIFFSLLLSAVDWNHSKSSQEIPNKHLC